ncbi:MAG: sodium-translocating pyrophosphatase [Clostridia bacterium]|nr:sodium-translocating pyrophosphatase [Clostridia bacterium]
MFWIITSIVVSFLAVGVAVYFYRWVEQLPSDNANATSIGKLIRDGAFTFLKREYRTLLIFCAAVSLVILFIYPNPIWTGKGLARNAVMLVSYLSGSALSGIAGFVGISIATLANVKSALAAEKGLAPAYMAGFRGGAVMGMAVVASSLFGAAVLYLVTRDAGALMAFSFGASSLALFAKAGGGIFTKTADIAADLAGKVELSIPEDDPRNPAVIADNVGDNVGDVAGMGADLFDSNVASFSAAIVIAIALNAVDLIFCFGSLGLLASIAGVLLARIGADGDPGKALNRGTYLTCAIFAIVTFLASLICGYSLRLWGAAVLGVVAGIVIGLTSEFFTGDDKRPVKMVARACESGPAFTILSGFSYGLLSSLPSMAGIGLSALFAWRICEPLGGNYPMLGISVAAIGMLSVVGMIISNDAYGPIVDNARGIAEMCDLGDDVLEITDKLDSAGNTSKAITKGFAIGAAGLTVIALLGAFIETVAGYGVTITLDLMNPMVLFGILTGASVPAVFSAMLILGVNRNAQTMVREIHRQFDTIPGLREGKPGVRPQYDLCIDIAARGAIRELVPAGLMAIGLTLLTGIVGNVQAVGGFLAGNIVSGLMLALLMSNAGGLWDNAKKYIEAGNCGGKGSKAHKAAVIGDTVGDPFKDTAGPSINTQITVVSLVSSLAAGLFIMISILA